MNIYLPIRDDSKSPAVSGWADPDYEGVEPEGRVGLRADGYVIVDCDSAEAAKAWTRITAESTWTVKTPRGYHFYYKASSASPTGPAVGVLPGIDIRAGSGSYVVAPPTPGYEVVDDYPPRLFMSGWLPERTKPEPVAGLGWDMIPEGTRNATLFDLAARMRGAGMSDDRVVQMLLGFNTGLCDPPLDRDEVMLIARSACKYEPGDGVVEIIMEEDDTGSESWTQILWGNEIADPPEPEWWWHPYIPKAGLVGLVGEEGIGKGMFCTWLAAAVAGGTTRDGGTDRKGVLWFPAEDDPETTIKARLTALGYDGEGIGFIPSWVWKFSQEPDHEKYAAALAHYIAVHNVGLVIMDPGRSYLGGVGERSNNSDAFVKPAMERLLHLCQATGTTFVFVHHLNKSNTATTWRDKVSGSGAFRQTWRHEIGMEAHNGEGVFAVTKSNQGQRGFLHSYHLEVENGQAFYEPGALVEGFQGEDEIMRWKKERLSEANDASAADLLYIALDQWPVGTQLPSRAALMSMTGLSQHKIRLGLRELKADQVIHETGKFLIWTGEQAELTS